MCLAWGICNTKFPKAGGLGLSGNAATRGVSCGCSTLTIWLGGVSIGSVVLSGDWWSDLAFFSSAHLEPRADFLWDFPS